ncbi:MAG: SCP2 sterol-binding domain-containing protein [Caldilineaceae bacterium]|nr:SCP2 sterol-binding domain-containing protein [Caldilineaceae bacterium]
MQKENPVAAPFPSQAWADQFCQLLNQHEAYQQAAQRWEGDVSLLIEGDGGLYLDLWHGTCRQATYLAAGQTKPAAYTITASRENWLQVLAGQLDPMQGMMTRQLRFEGNLMKLMQYLQAAQELVKCAAQVGVA